MFKHLHTKMSGTIQKATNGSSRSVTSARAFGTTPVVRKDTNLVEPDDRFRDYFRKYKEANAVRTIPYSDNVPQVDNFNPVPFKRKKVTVIGMGNVGLGCVASILNQDMCGAIAMIDMNKDKLEGEAKDFQQGADFHQATKILASTEYDVSADSDLVIVTAGAAQKPGQSRLELLEVNCRIMEAIIPQVIEYSPNAAILIATNPCDIMTAVAAKIAGPSLPQGRIFGAGTAIDTSRFQTIIANSMDIDPNSIHGYIIGEHGDSSIPVWSSVRIGANPLLQPGEEPPDTLKAVHKAVVDSAYDVIKLKGYTNWAIGMSTAHIAKAVLHDSRTIIPVSTCVRGLYGIEHDVFLSMPCNVSRDGVLGVAKLPLTDSEKESFQKSAEHLWEIQKPIWDKVGV